MIHNRNICCNTSLELSTLHKNKTILQGVILEQLWWLASLSVFPHYGYTGKFNIKVTPTDCEGSVSMYKCFLTFCLVAAEMKSYALGCKWH